MSEMPNCPTCGSNSMVKPSMSEAATYFCWGDGQNCASFTPEDLIPEILTRLDALEKEVFVSLPKPSATVRLVQDLEVHNETIAKLTKENTELKGEKEVHSNNASLWRDRFFDERKKTESIRGDLNAQSKIISNRDAIITDLNAELAKLRAKQADEERGYSERELGKDEVMSRDTDWLLSPDSGQSYPVRFQSGEKASLPNGWKCFRRTPIKSREQLTAENDKLRAALEPFSKISISHGVVITHEHGPCMACHVPVSAVLAAQEAMK